jgi:dimethylsulfoniopropionate demethylase
MTREDNPIECGLSHYCQLDGSIEYIGKEALQRIARQGPKRMIRGLLFDGEACPACQAPWTVSVDGTKVGYVTTC